MRRRRENFEIQELKRSFLVLKTRKIDQNRVKNSGKIAPKARNFLGYFGDFWSRMLDEADYFCTAYFLVRTEFLLDRPRPTPMKFGNRIG